MKNFAWVFSLLALFSSCEYLSWDLNSDKFKLEITQVSQVESRSAVIDGKIYNPGNEVIDEVGFVISTSTGPSLSNVRVLTNVIDSEASSGLTSLVPETKYFVRMYAIIEGSTYYSSERSFTTAKPLAVLVGSNSCSSLNGITSVYFGMNGTSAPWGSSSSGYSGTCWVAPDPNNFGQLGTVVGSNHFVQFNRNFLSQGYIEFWVNTSNPGYNNLIPDISVNGSVIGSATMIEGEQSSFYWMKVRSPIIQSGNNSIKILFSGSYYVLKIDELEFFELE